MKVTMRPNLAKSVFLWPFCHDRMLNDDSLNCIGCVMGNLSVLGKMRSRVKASKVKVTSRVDMVKKWRHMHRRLSVEFYLVSSNFKLLCFHYSSTFSC